jgi:hypothetical protein
MARRTLSKETNEGIARDLANGVSPVQIAKTYGVSIPTVYNKKKLLVTVATSEVK